MQIKVYTINVKLPRWLRRTLALGVVPAAVLGICAIVYATAVTGQPDFVAGTPLTASSMNAHLGALQTQIDTLTHGSPSDFTVAGKLGVGTASPLEALQVNGNLRLSNASMAGIRALTPTYWGYSTGYPVVQVGPSNGVGTVSIGYDPSGNPNLGFTGDGREVLFRNGVQFTTPNATNDSFYTSNLVLKDGNVGIGTLSPSGKLTIKADKTGFQELSNQLVIKGGTKDNLNLSLGMMTDISAAMIQSNENGVINHDLLLNPNGGRVGVNTTAAQYSLDVTGTIRGDNVTPSDRSLKKNIEPLPADTLGRVCKISGVSFEWDRQKLKESLSRESSSQSSTRVPEVDGFPKTPQIGLIAQDVEKVFPSLVETDSKGVKSIHYMGVTAVLLEAVKSQQKQIEELRARVRALEEPPAGARAAHARPARQPSRRAAIGIDRLPTRAPGA